MFMISETWTVKLPIPTHPNLTYGTIDGIALLEHQAIEVI